MKSGSEPAGGYSAFHARHGGEPENHPNQFLVPAWNIIFLPLSVEDFLRLKVGDKEK